MKPVLSPTLTIAAAAAELQVTAAIVTRWIQAGHLPAVDDADGHGLRILRVDWERFIRDHCQGGPDGPPRR